MVCILTGNMASKRYKNPDKFFQNFGLRIKQLREENGWTQEDMIGHGLSYRFYQRIEAGKPLHFKTVMKIADIFGLTLDKLLKDL